MHLVFRISFFVACICFSCFSVAEAIGVKKELIAQPVAESIEIDGKLDEPAWAAAGVATDFIQNFPNPGVKSGRQSKVRVLYDNTSVYVGAFLYESQRDSILRQLSSRDDDAGNTDQFGVTFDTYSDRQNALGFYVTAAGVQVDAIVKFDGSDYSWNAAWFSKVTITDSGWCVEMRIPYSALRFPKKDTQLWNVNFYRVIRRVREKSYWNEVDPAVSNILGQAGLLKGITNIQSPVRLAFLPYVSAYGENYKGANGYTLNGGMDIKYGLNESFTLDMTLVPDFGQTLFDNRVLNLSPIEVRYVERRYFFTEGVTLFNKNDLFYSRRVGGTPIGYNNLAGNLATNEMVLENTSTTRLYNATKISGRTNKRLGVGFFNAVATPAYGKVRDTTTGAERDILTSPLTNYNVVVLDQALKNNSFISFINTNVSRKNYGYDANVAAMLFKFANKANRYAVEGSADVSQLYNVATPDVGHRYYLSLAKISGAYTAFLRTRSISDHFNPNDLGYLDRNNITSYIFEQYYNIYHPIGFLNNAYNHVGINYFRVFNPDVFQKFNVYGSHNTTFRNFLTTGFYWEAYPVKSNDYYEPRTFGRFYEYPKNIMVGGFYSSDYRKKFALDLELSERKFQERNRNDFTWSISPRYRFSDKLSMIYEFSDGFIKDDVGFVNNRNDSIFLGVRDLKTVTNTLYAAYIFTNTMSLKLNARHYWSQAKYTQYTHLGKEGDLTTVPYNVNHNINFNTVNVFMSLVWQFKPGSEMSLVYQNSIYGSGQDILNNYFDDVSYASRFPQSNSLSIKMIYFLDYLTIKSAFARN